MCWTRGAILATTPRAHCTLGATCSRWWWRTSRRELRWNSDRLHQTSLQVQGNTNAQCCGSIGKRAACWKERSSPTTRHLELEECDVQVELWWPRTPRDADERQPISVPIDVLPRQVFAGRRRPRCSNGGVGEEGERGGNRRSRRTQSRCTPIAPPSGRTARRHSGHAVSVHTPGAVGA